MRALSRESPSTCAQGLFCIALGPLIHPPFDLRSTSFLLLKWENDGRTMGELRTKERRKNDRVYIGHQDGKQNRMVIISLSRGETVVHHALHI